MGFEPLVPCMRRASSHVPKTCRDLRQLAKSSHTQLTHLERLATVPRKVDVEACKGLVQVKGQPIQALYHTRPARLFVVTSRLHYYFRQHPLSSS